MPVRTLNDLRNGEGPSNQAMPNYNNGLGQAQVPRNQQNGGFNRMQGANIIVVGDDDPENNAVFPSMSKTLAPNFSKHTFIFYITVIQIIMFIVELLWGQIKYNEMFNEDNTMAGPGTDTMIDLGGKKTSLIQDGELWRLIMPALLHGGILHIFMNLFFQTMLCYTYELKWGTGRMAYFYFMTGVGSSLMSATQNANAVSVGASGCLFGMLGCQMAYLIMNWNVNPYAALGPNVQPVGGFGGAPPPPNQMEMCQLVCIILMNFSFSSSGATNEGSHIDNWAHGGGLLCGFLIGFPFVAKAEAPPSCFSNVQYVKMFFLAGTILFFGLELWTLFFDMD